MKEKEQEKKPKRNNIRSRLNALVRRSIPDAFKGGARHTVETSVRRVQRRHEAEETTPKRRKWPGTRSRPGANTFAPGCLLCYIFARRTGWPFKTPRCHFVGATTSATLLVSLANANGPVSSSKSPRALTRLVVFPPPPSDNDGLKIKRYTRSSLGASHPLVNRRPARPDFSSAGRRKVAIKPSRSRG